MSNVSVDAGSPEAFRLLTCNLQAGVCTRHHMDYFLRLPDHVLPTCKGRGLSEASRLASGHDIVALQECDTGSVRSRFINQAERLAMEAGFEYCIHQANRRVGRISTSGVGFLSRQPLQDIQGFPLPARVPGRGVLFARMQLAKRWCHLGVVHLSLSAPMRARQLACIAELAQDRQDLILMGDFNCSAFAPEMQHLYRKTNIQAPDNELPSHPSWAPRRAIDHILASSSLRLTGHAALPSPASDHCALSAMVEWAVP